MTIRELLNLISQVAKQKGTSEPFIVGGVPRDKMLNRLSDIQDIDLTTGDDSIFELATAVNQVLSANYPDVYMKTFPDGHSQISVQGMKVDFSSNYRSPQAKQLLEVAGFKNPSSMILELMSRDFTCNTLLMTLDFSTIKDPTGMGINDIKNKILKTPLPPKITLSNDNKRIVRVIYLSTKLGFNPEQQIMDFVASNPNLIQNVKDKYISDKISEALIKDKEKTINLLNKMNLWKSIPISNDLIPYASGRF